jgi:hypothetical protein
VETGLSVKTAPLHILGDVAVAIRRTMCAERLERDVLHPEIDSLCNGAYAPHNAKVAHQLPGGVQVLPPKLRHVAGNCLPVTFWQVQPDLDVVCIPKQLIPIAVLKVIGAVHGENVARAIEA